MFRETIKDTWRQNTKPTKANLKRARLWRRRLGILSILGAIVMIALAAYQIATHGISSGAVAFGFLFVILTFIGGMMIAPQKSQEKGKNHGVPQTQYRSRAKHSKAKS